MSASLLGLIIISVFVTTFVLCAALSTDEPIDILVVLCIIFIALITIFGMFYTNKQNEKLEKYGTYPDTTISIKNGVRDTSIIYKVYEEKNN